MRDFDAIKKKEMSSIENRVRHVYNIGYETGYAEGQKHDLEHTENIVRSHEKCKSVLEAEYERGLNDAWACCKRFLNTDDICYEMGYSYNWDDFLAQSPSEVIARLKEYDAKDSDDTDNCKIEVGDEVRDDMFDKVGVVIRIEDNHAYVLKKDGIGTWTLDAVVKTGTHFEKVSDMMKHLENTDA